jgi:hypothetical protein
VSYSALPQITNDEAIISTGEAIAGSPARASATGTLDPILGAMQLDLSGEEAAALTQELHDIIESDHYPFSPRIRTLRGILAKLRPQPVREPLPPPKVYAPPRTAAAKRRRAGR